MARSEKSGRAFLFFELRRREGFRTGPRQNPAKTIQKMLTGYAADILMVGQFPMTRLNQELTG
jgi:hypothetical protein